MSKVILFGEYVRERRQELGLSLRDVASKLGISYVYLGEVERSAKGSLAQKHWKKLASVLRVKVELLEKWDEWSYCPCCERKLTASGR